MAELPRNGLPRLITLTTLIWQSAVACVHVAPAWKEGVINTFLKKLDTSEAVNYRGITPRGVLGKCRIRVCFPYT